MLVRDRFRGQGVVNAIVDLPFALPTIVAGLTLLALYGPRSPVDVNVAFTRWAILLALLFVTLPFVVRTVQPVLLELDREMEDAAARSVQVEARDVSPHRPAEHPAGRSFGMALAFARAVGEFGAVVLISETFRSRRRSLRSTSSGQIESGDAGGAASARVVILAITFARSAGSGDAALGDTA